MLMIGLALVSFAMGGLGVLEATKERRVKGNEAASEEVVKLKRVK